MLLILASCSMAVSYTHLDVYKRQAEKALACSTAAEVKELLEAAAR